MTSLLIADESRNAGWFALTRHAGLHVAVCSADLAARQYSLFTRYGLSDRSFSFKGIMDVKIGQLLARLKNYIINGKHRTEKS